MKGEIGVEDHAPRVVTQMRYGAPMRLYIKPADYSFPLLAAQMGDVFVDLSKDVPGSVNDLAGAIRSFLHHLEGQLHDSSNLETFGLADLRLRHLDAWELARLTEQRQFRTDTAYRRAVHLFNVFRRINQDTPGLLHREVALRLTRQTRLSHIRRDGDSDHPPSEVRRIRSAAHRVVYSALAKQAEGRYRGPFHNELYALHVLLSLATPVRQADVRHLG